MDLRIREQRHGRPMYRPKPGVAVQSDFVPGIATRSRLNLRIGDNPQYALPSAFKASDATPIHHTISKDRTAGEQAVQASLLADCFQRLQPNVIITMPSVPNEVEGGRTVPVVRVDENHKHLNQSSLRDGLDKSVNNLSELMRHSQASEDWSDFDFDAFLQNGDGDGTGNMPVDSLSNRGDGDDDELPHMDPKKFYDGVFKHSIEKEKRPRLAGITSSEGQREVSLRERDTQREMEHRERRAQREMERREKYIYERTNEMNEAVYADKNVVILHHPSERHEESRHQLPPSRQSPLQRPSRLYPYIPPAVNREDYASFTS